MSSQIFTIIILAKSFISFKTLFIYCISIHDLCIGNKLFLYRCLRITQLKKLLITHFHNNVWLWLSRIHRMFKQFIRFLVNIHKVVLKKTNGWLSFIKNQKKERVWHIKLTPIEIKLIPTNHTFQLIFNHQGKIEEEGIYMCKLTNKLMTSNFVIFCFHKRKYNKC